MQPTRQITVFFSFLAVLTLTGGLLLALEPEPLAPVETVPTLVVATDNAPGASTVGQTLAEKPATESHRASGVTTSGR